MCMITHSSFGPVQLCMIEHQDGEAHSGIVVCHHGGVRAEGKPYVSFDTSGLLTEALQLLHGLYRHASVVCHKLLQVAVLYPGFS